MARLKMRPARKDASEAFAEFQPIRSPSLSSGKRVSPTGKIAD